VLLASGPDVLPGQQIQCTATPPNGVVFASVAFLTPNALVEDTNAPFTAALTIPLEAAGEYPLSYLARDTASNTWWGTQMLSVTPPSPPSFLEAEPRRFTFASLGATRQISVLGNYFGVVERDLTAPDTGTTYSSGDPNVVSVDTNGVMTARGSGPTLISITNGGRYAFVDVLVAPSPRSDLTLTMAASVTNAFAGVPVTFTLQVTNAGPQTANGVYLTDPLPPGSRFYAATASQGAWSFTNGVFTVEFGSLAPGGEAVATFTLVFTLGGATLNTASISAVGMDVRSEDNLAAVAVDITALPLLAIRLEPAQVILVWPTNAVGFELERTTNLSPPPFWEPAATNRPVVGDHFELSLSPTNAPAFFRLRHQ
jgi:uncharacterized repeat protein (TIGR01451 family)